MEKKENLITIIIPVYNVENYLSECVESVIAQSYKNLEIILVDDGSKDSSGKICDELATKDDRIKVIHKENGGLSDARNVGIEASSGDFICFVDSDDIIDKNFVLIHYNALISNEADLSVCLYKKFVDKSELLNLNQTKNPEIVKMNKNELINQLFLRNNIHYICACTKMYKKQIFNDLRFDKGRLYEDEFIVYKVFNSCENAVFINSELYFYRGRPGSITRQASFKEKNLDSFYAIESCYNFFKNTEFEQPALNRLVNSTAYSYCAAKSVNAEKKILKFLFTKFKEYYKINKQKTLKQRAFRLFPNLICKLKRLK